MKPATPAGAARRAPQSTAVTPSLNPGTVGLSFADLKDHRPVRSHAGYVRCCIGPDRFGRDQHVLLKPEQIPTKRAKYPVLFPVEVVTR